jgi:ATP-binding cassette subfamily B protein
MQKNAFYPSLVLPLVEFFIILLVSIIFLYFFFYGNLETEFIVEFIILLIITLRIFQALTAIIPSLMRANSLYPSINFLLNEIKYENKPNSNLEYKKDICDSIKELSINNITYGYDEDNKIFENASINFKKNTVNVIIGRSGEGKTTFFNILSGLIKFNEGKILINNTFNLLELNKDNYLSKIAYVTQNPYIINDTIENNININLEKIDFNKFKKATKLSLVDDFISMENLNYQTILEENGRNFSQGQLQRISLARAIYRSPDVYLFDESTSALDEENQKKIIENIKLIKENSIVIIISHRLEILEIADNVYEIKNKQFNKIDAPHKKY